MTAIRLQDAALARFARQGFDATSLAEIAADVGIKKPSIYAHFQSKDELYLSLIPRLVEAELEHAGQVLHGGQGAVGQLRAYLQDIRTRYENSEHVAFWFKALLAPPLHIYDAVMAPMHVFMDNLEDIIRTAIKGSPLAENRRGLSIETLTLTYMGLIDALQSELIYGGADKFERRLEAMWQVFETASGGPDLPRL